MCVLFYPVKRTFGRMTRNRLRVTAEIGGGMDTEMGVARKVYSGSRTRDLSIASPMLYR